MEQMQTKWNLFITYKAWKQKKWKPALKCSTVFKDFFFLGNFPNQNEHI